MNRVYFVCANGKLSVHWMLKQRLKLHGWRIVTISFGYYKTICGTAVSFCDPFVLDWSHYNGVFSDLIEIKVNRFLITIYMHLQSYMQTS